MRNDRQAYSALSKSVCVKAKLDRISKTNMPFRMRLAATLAADTRPGKVW